MKEKAIAEAVRKSVETPQPPVMVTYVCDTCGNTGVAAEECEVLCQLCINVFLKRNVGTMHVEKKE